MSVGLVVKPVALHWDKVGALHALRSAKSGALIYRML